MAFKYVKYGPPLVAWCDGENICVEEPTGTIAKYPCAIGVVIPKQLIEFTARETMFILRHDGITYYGRQQGTFSGIRDKDGVLVRFGRWQAPEERILQPVGTYRASGGHAAMLDLNDQRTVYISGIPRAYVFHKKFDVNYFMPSAIGDMIAQKQGLHINTYGGSVDIDAAGKWFVPSLPWSRDRAVSL